MSKFVQVPSNSTDKNSTKAIEKLIEKYVHLDLKGAPPKPAYLKSLYPLLKKWGVSGVILEWEDCFPYKGNLDVLNNNIYSQDDAQQIVQDLRDAKLNTIPLVQTFGHLEFVLKHSAYAGYREVPLYPSSLCPSHPDSLALVTALVEQVINFHPGIRQFHIGADEVWHMGLCERCRQRIEAGESKEDLFVKHVKAVLEVIKGKWPELDLIMWDDMLRGMDESVIYAYNLKPLVEPMVWHYNSSETFALPPDIWSKYSYFSGVWIAGAFKGASGGSQLVPPTSHHASNILHWTTCLQLLKSPCRGFVLTGWSRYDHFAALCETLATSLPSLGACLLVANEANFGSDVIPRVEADLKLPELSLLAKSSNPESQMLFSSWQILILVSRVMTLRQSAVAMLNCDQLQTWMNDWQVANNRVNPMQLVPIIPVLTNTVEEFNNIERALRIHMSDVFYPATVEEWIATYIDIMRSRIQSALSTAENIISRATKFFEDANKMDY